MNLKLFIDFETNGLPQRLGFDKYYDPRDTYYYDNARIIEGGYIICDDGGNIVKMVNHFIIPNGFSILNSHIHGITEEKIRDEGGISVETFLEILKEDLRAVDTIIAHNALFDTNILLSECYRCGKEDLVNYIRDKKIECTMSIGKIFMKNLRYPKLVELYKFLFDEEFNQEHRAISDTIHCMRCYYRMKRVQQ